MKAIILKNKNLVELGTFNDPVLKDDDVMIEVKYCGLCGSDLHKYEGRKTVRPLTYPAILGHEISGIVKNIGKNVKNFKVGDRVTADPNYACGECYYCKHNLPHLCENSKGLVKGMADYVCCVEQNVYHIPDSLDLLPATLIEPISCCVHGINTLELHKEDTLAIIGIGGIGSIMIQLAKLKGIKTIIALDIDDNKKEKAIKLGASLFINPLNENYLKEINNLYINKIMECSGDIKSLKTCMDIACKHATIVMFGLTKPEETAELSVYDLTLKEINLKGSIVNLNGMEEAIDLLSQNKINTDLIISQVVTPEEMVQEIKEKQLIKNGKVIVKWDI